MGRDPGGCGAAEGSEGARDGWGAVLMPSKPRRPCTHPGCRALTTDGRCDKHPRKAWGGEGQDPDRLIRGRTLQRERERLFAEQPLCVLCERAGRVSAATIRDHVVPLAEGGEDTQENTQS